MDQLITHTGSLRTYLYLHFEVHILGNDIFWLFRCKQNKILCSLLENVNKLIKMPLASYTLEQF